MTKYHSKPPRVQALDQASALINGDRDKEYGHPKENFDRFRTMVNAYLGKRSEEHTSELQSLAYIVCRLLLEKKTSYEK